jgi:hypothetical protein
MDLMLAYVNAFTCGLISLVLVAAILSPRVQDGVVIKVGLIAMAMGFGSLALRLIDKSNSMCDPHWQRSILLVNFGIATVVMGYLLRRAMAHHQLRRLSDWLTQGK